MSMSEAELAAKLHDTVFGPETNEHREEEQQSEEAQPDEQEEAAEEEETTAEEAEVEAEPESPARREEEGTVVEDDDEEEEPPADDDEDEEQATAKGDDFYVFRYKNREEAERGFQEQANTIGRQSREIGQMRAQLEEQAQQINALTQQAQTSGGLFAPDFEASTVEQAIESIEENELGPAAYIDQALREDGNIDLAFAICDAWEEHNPVYARSVRRKLEQVHAATANYVEPEPEPQPLTVDAIGQSLAVLAQHIPDFDDYQEAMSQVSAELPDDHWIAQDLESGDERARLRALHTVYELAKGRSVGIASAREQIKQQQKQKGASARKRAAVASGQASAGGSDTPRNNTARFRENMRSEWRRQGLIATE